MGTYMGHEYADAPAHAEQVQGRYRVGDMVRVVKTGWPASDDGSYHGADVGEIDVVIGFDRDDRGRERVEGKEWFYPFSEIAPAFRPGDRVKLNKHRDLHACGDRGTVKRVFSDSVEVTMDLRSAFAFRSYVFPAEYLDLARDESAPDCAGRKVEQDNAPATDSKPKPKFKAGDRVVYKDGGGEAGIIKCVKTEYGSDGAPYSGSTAYEYEDGGWDYESSLVLATPQPCIVARVNQFGTPMPSSSPHVHVNAEAATAEAERLARANPGQEFAVYQRVAGRKAEVQMKEVA